MRGQNRTNILLVELLIAVLFFMLSATVLVQVFAAANNQSIRTGVETRALAEAQNTAALLCSEGNAGEKLVSEGFDLAHGVYTKGFGEYTLLVEMNQEEMAAGKLTHADISAYYKRDELLFSLPCERYEEGEL